MPSTDLYCAASDEHDNDANDDTTKERAKRERRFGRDRQPEPTPIADRKRRDAAANDDDDDVNAANAADDESDASNDDNAPQQPGERRDESLVNMRSVVPNAASVDNDDEADDNDDEDANEELMRAERERAVQLTPEQVIRCLCVCVCVCVCFVFLCTNATIYS